MYQSKFFLIILFLSFGLLSGCASNKIYGSFLSRSESKTYSEPAAKEAALELNRRFPDNKTVFLFSHNTDDLFGKNLIQNLRAYGYGIIPYDKNNKQLKASASPSDSLLIKAKTDIPTKDPIILSYSFAPIYETNFFALIMKLPSLSLKKLFFKENKNLYPAGPWVSEEK